MRLRADRRKSTVIVAFAGGCQVSDGSRPCGLNNIDVIMSFVSLGCIGMVTSASVYLINFKMNRNIVVADLNLDFIRNSL